MGKWLDIKGPVVADTVYADNTLVAKDVAFTLPGLEFMTADVMAMGNMTVPLVGLLENMELTITKIGVDMGLSRLGRLEKQNLEFRWVQNVVKSDGTQGTEGCKAFVRVMPAALPSWALKSDPRPKRKALTLSPVCRSTQTARSICAWTD